MIASILTAVTSKGTLSVRACEVQKVAHRSLAFERDIGDADEGGRRVRQ